jgi:hypothetical protein
MHGYLDPPFRQPVCGCHRMEVCPDCILCGLCGESTGAVNVDDCAESRDGIPVCTACRMAEIEEELEAGTYQEDDPDAP